jgi:hypothetical protein
MDITAGLVLSAHLFFENNYNAIHPHVQIEEDNYIAGAYLNSEVNISVYSGRRFVIDEKSSIEIGGVSGYGKSPLDLMPFAKYTYTTDDNQKYFVAPSPETINGKTKMGIVIGVEIPFGFK